MKLPVWSLELVRDTNAPMDAVVHVLSDGANFHRWHPRLRAVSVQLGRTETDFFEASYCLRPCLGVEERGNFVIKSEAGRLLLIHTAKFKGWPVLILMGWWRVRSHRMWECLVRSL